MGDIHVTWQSTPFWTQMCGTEIKHSVITMHQKNTEPKISISKLN